MQRPYLPPAVAGSKALQGVPVQVQVVAPREPNHQLIVCFQPETQGATPHSDFFDFLGKAAIVPVTFPAPFAAALELLA